MDSSLGLGGEQNELMKKRQFLGKPTFGWDSWVGFSNMKRSSIFPEKVYHISKICGGQEKEQSEKKKGNSFEI